MAELREYKPDGGLKLNFHEGQMRAWNSTSRFIAVIAGSQSGKTSWGPLWLLREIQRRGPGDYFVVTPSFVLLELKALPEFREVFEYRSRLGRFITSPVRKFVFSQAGSDYLFGANNHDPGRPTTVFFGHADNPQSLESATAKGAWLDECLAPETRIETERGPLTIQDIVSNRLDVKVWTYSPNNQTWQLRRILRWIKIPQNKKLLPVAGLRITGNHKIYLRDRGYMEAGEISSAHASISGAKEIFYACKMQKLPWPVEASGPEGLLLQQMQRSIQSGEDRQTDQDVLSRSQESGAAFGEQESLLCRSGESSVGTAGRKLVQPSREGKKEILGGYQEKPDMEAGRERATEKLEAGETGPGVGVGERVSGKNQQRLAAPCIQDRRGRAEFQDRPGSWEPGQPEEDSMVCSEWVDISALQQSDGGDLYGGRSQDGYVYNLEIEEEHNYVANGIVVQNCGQKKFRLDSWEALQRRLALNQGRALLTTTPYDLGWLKTEVWDRWRSGDPDYDVINFPSTANPNFPIAEAERMRNTLPRWKYEMFVLGLFSKPAGLIYDCFDEDVNTRKYSPPPNHWKRVIGIDFGGLNTAAVYYALSPTSNKFYQYREYHPRLNRTARQHAVEICKGEPHIQTDSALGSEYVKYPREQYTFVGGSRSEGQWRLEFASGGLDVLGNLTPEVEIGIDRVYGQLQCGHLILLDHRDRTRKTFDEYLSYAREVDAYGTPIPNTIDEKETYHLMDASRYAVSYIGDPHQPEPWSKDELQRLDPDALIREAARGILGRELDDAATSDAYDLDPSDPKFRHRLDRMRKRMKRRH